MVYLVLTQQRLFSDLSDSPPQSPPLSLLPFCFPIIKHRYPSSLSLSLSIITSLFAQRNQPTSWLKTSCFN
ncbi:hypothetical protein NC652_010916 [Populus alba x Populus x berolinensis]|uniref:Uncharacterized protein n=1 Tax=Populus alba x Populus x berolinensis TaxID=444605 RepID=A0AAD6W5R8_9ROSI|nr:hypothetical protein NC652_010916 [Populus alba x Populus x berolinensis]KAJ7000353.1 hypothetical protein NC653_010976 [Populus alba x Populus x berolinensis]